MSMAAALVSVGNDEGDDADRLRRACVATLCELGMIQLVSCSLKERLNCILGLNFFFLCFKLIINIFLPSSKSKLNVNALLLLSKFLA